MEPSLIDSLPDTGRWYRDRYEIFHKDIDFNGELRLSSLLLMAQETAWNHARLVGIDYRQDAFKDIIWVLSRMRLEILGPQPGWMATMELATSPVGVEKLFALRDFLAVAEGRPFARFTSAWIMIDPVSRRPVRPQSLLDGFEAHFNPSVWGGEKTRKLHEPEGLVWLGTVTPGYADIDAHRHANNVSYAQWCLDTLGQDHYQRYRALDFDINFLSELAWGQAVRVARVEVPAEGAEDAAHGFVVRKESGETAAVVRVGWQGR